jgi:tetratricopeptide (TPR) repeat protein
LKIGAARQVVETVEEQSGERLYVYIGYVYQSFAESRIGQFEAATASVAKAEVVAQELGQSLIHGDWLAVVNVEIALGTGRVQEAIALAERAAGIAQEMNDTFGEGLARGAWGQAIAALAPPASPEGQWDGVKEAGGAQWDEAEAQLAESLRLLELGGSRLEAARTHVAWGAVCRDRGDSDAAREHWERAAAQWETSGLTRELERTRVLIESLG